MPRLPYEEWKKQVDRILYVMLGLTSDCMPDVDYSSWYRDGLSPTRAAKRAIQIGGSF